ncbi:MAG: ATP-dependent Clp protease adaptor ClpS [Chlorobium sp.]|jgi:ATP-dependent Clp protease adaptor protein ClpS|uniref:ATP-dependent Clp protease adaptor ClpS n=1 Tax=Chlorobium sp. TaxID=1095 RepID=UPI001D824AEA|nr:ATP-dependent Clp protease adaptor ClpS [Chlorobium sp.]MBN1278317.1 ATP-dependent Clp protease adaptor ClpS [Chlorobiaceae bacterium]MCF8216879.1 ATP-dependent Clp protease adaptor ClpS [Chlorobium sp.]MCF8271708.1 ATP-dependent Clp protease adaptor ClpS [Chlorobium sp.]MCF8288096.1 ATP-dependent Clp protease adaptor ClpS [Chlorobium sp.]MCF8291687.1 ATP-dependent Clp protease adaptor ClpS [Chlorobium sp.]
MFNQLIGASEWPEPLQQEYISGTTPLDAYRVVLFNDEEHSFDEVIFQIIKAVNCSRSKAEKLTWEVHSKGRAIVYSGSIERCIYISAVLEEIALKTEIQTG